MGAGNNDRSIAGSFESALDPMARFTRKFNIGIDPDPDLKRHQE